MSVPARRSDTSALSLDDFPEAELAIDKATDALEDVETLKDWKLNGDDLVIDGAEINRAVQKAMEQLQRELIDNRSSMNRNISGSLKLASAQLRQHGTELRKAMREASRALAIHCDSEMQ